MRKMEIPGRITALRVYIEERKGCRIQSGRIIAHRRTRSSIELVWKITVTLKVTRNYVEKSSRNKKSPDVALRDKRDTDESVGSLKK